jgi:hypothetical protein
MREVDYYLSQSVLNRLLPVRSLVLPYRFARTYSERFCCEICRGSQFRRMRARAISFSPPLTKGRSSEEADFRCEWFSFQ